jgi:PAS domain S-box-containing protein
MRPRSGAGSGKSPSGAKVRVGRARKTRADLEAQLKACRREIARVRERLAEAMKQQTATSEMLRLISNAPIQSVLDAVAEHSARLCDASNARIWRLEDNLVRLVASHGESSATMDGREGLPLNRDTVTARAACDRRTIHVHDIAAEDSEYPLGSRLVKDQGWRTTLATPLLREGTPIGTILVRRTEVRPFSDRQIALLETFADQAAIAIENVRLFQAEKQSEAQLAKAQRELQQLVDTIQTPVVSYSADKRREFVNAAWKQYTGLSDEAALGAELSVVTHPDHIATNERLWRDALATGKPWHTEERVRRADGQYRWFAMDRVAARDENGKIIKWYATGYDIDDRKRAEERLRVQHTVAQILAEAATIEEAAPRILLAIGECLGWDVGVLWRVDREAKALRCVELWHEASIKVPEFARVSRELTFGPGLGLPGRVWSGRAPEYIPDVVPDENFPRASIAEREGVHAAFGFPILLGGEVLGVIEFFSREIRQPDEALLSMLATIGSQIGQFIERTRAEQALREREARIRRLVDANIIGIFIWDFDGQVLEANEAFLRIVGYDQADLVAGRLRWTELTPPEWRDRDAQLIQEQRVAGTLQPFEKEYFRKDGSRVPVLIGVATFEEGGSQGVAFVLDLTERKRAEEALRRSEAWLALAQRLSRTGNWVYDPTTIRYSYWSDESYRIWGFDPLQGLPSYEDVWKRIHPEDRDRVRGEIREALRAQRGFVSEFRILLPDGTVKHLDATTLHQFSPAGTIVEAVSTQVDVTERKRAQNEREKLRQLESDLAHMNRVSMMGALAVSLAHEITQPIASARNNARAALNFLDKQLPDVDDVREALDCIVGDADRAGDIIDRIRDHIKKAPPRKDRFDLGVAIDEVMVLARDAIIRNNISARICLADGLPLVQGDRVQLQQVLLNLILNAVEAMGSVEAGPRELLISAEEDHAGVRVAVRDSGPGIDPAYLERVFDAFYTTKPSGVGMGLSICRSIIHSHGGRLWAELNASRGTVFHFNLPSAQAPRDRMTG